MDDVDQSQRWDAEVSRMLVSFQYAFFYAMQRARDTGLVPEDTTDVELARAVIGIVADQYGPLSLRNKKLEKALRR